MECGLYIVKGGNSKHKNIVKFTIFRPGPKNFLLRSVNFLGPGLSRFLIKNFFHQIIKMYLLISITILKLFFYLKTWN